MSHKKTFYFTHKWINDDLKDKYFIFQNIIFNDIVI
jgi:hypothetical protein